MARKSSTARASAGPEGPARRLGALQRELLEMVAAGSRLEPILGRLCSAIEELVPGVCCAAMLVQPRDLSLHLVAAPTLPSELRAALHTVYPESGNGSCALAASRGEPVVCEQIAGDSRWSALREAAEDSGITAACSVPVLGVDLAPPGREPVHGRIEPKVLGTMALYFSADRGPLEADMELLELAAAHATGVIQAVEARHRSHQQRSFDSLTGLPNRRLFTLELERGIHHANPRHSRFAMIIVDLDHFKELNETVGFAAGDAVLRAVAERLVDLRRPADLLARFGDDDFAFLLSDFARDTEVENLARQIVSTVGRPLDFGGQELLVTASVGASLFPWDGEDAATLLRNAETAVHAAKRLGRSRAQLYAATLGTADFGTMELKTALRHAVEDEQLELLFQPQVHGETGEVRGVEALVYWRHPARGRIPPAEFIGLAERIGMIVPIGDWVLRRACATAARLRASGSDLTLAVNVSVIQLRERGFVASVAEILESTGLPPEALELEVTESAAMIDVEATLSTLREIRRLGVAIAIDDFGTGYSSLEYLQRFPIHALKIDHSFVRALPDNTESSAIVQAILALAEALHLQVVAEGVETLPQAELLRRFGCHYFQGYLYAHPLGAEELAEWLEAGGAAGEAAEDG